MRLTKLLGLILLFVVVSSGNIVNAKESFKDLQSVSWAEDAIYYLNERGIINGYGNGVFGPSDNITRGQAALMLVREIYPDEVSNTKLTFSDVDSKSVYYNAIAVAVDKGIFNGYSDGTFKPNAPITRAATAKILTIAYDLKGVKTNFQDIYEESWATEYINALASNNISNGYSQGYIEGSFKRTFKPNNTITRAEFSLLFARTLDETFKPKLTREDYHEYYEYIVTKIAMEADKENTVVEKILYVYNALAKHIEYEYEASPTHMNESHMATGAIVNGKAFCDGYSLALVAVLERLDIEAHRVISWPMNHSWVMVNIDGEYYHMDLTWDDRGYGGTNYDYFLLSDKEIEKAEHYDWETDLTATSDKYLYIKETLFPDDRYRKPIDFKEGYYYYLNATYTNDETNGIIIKVSFDQSIKEVVPHTKFKSVLAYEDWYLGVNVDSKTNTTAIYKFKMGAEEELLVSFNGVLSYYFIIDGVFKYVPVGSGEYREIQID